MAGRRLGLMMFARTGAVPTPSAAGAVRTTLSAFGRLHGVSGAGGLQAALSGSCGGYPALSGRLSALSAACCGLPTLSAAARGHAALSVPAGGLPSLSAAGSFVHTLSAVSAARDLGGSGGPFIISFAGSLVVIGVAGSVVYDLLDSCLKSVEGNEKREVNDQIELEEGKEKRELEGDDTWQEDQGREESRLLELMEGLLDEIKKGREDLAQRKKKFDEESVKKQASFDEERKTIDNGKRLLDDDRRKFHQERFEFDGGKKDGKKDKKDGKFDKFLERLEYYLRMPGKLIGLKRTVEEFETVYQVCVVLIPAYGSLLFAGKFLEFFKACYRAIFTERAQFPLVSFLRSARGVGWSCLS